MSLSVVDFYYLPNTSRTRKIVEYITNNEVILSTYYFRLKNITKEQVKAEARRYGVEKVPSFLIEGKLYSGVNKIFKILSEAANNIKTAQTKRFKTETDLLSDYLMTEALAQEEEEDDLSESMNDEDMRRRMAELYGKKPHCQSDNNKLKSKTTTRKLTGNPRQINAKNDQDFLDRAGRNVDPRGEPSTDTTIVEDGDSMLDKYYQSVI